MYLRSFCSLQGREHLLTAASKCDRHRQRQRPLPPSHGKCLQRRFAIVRQI